MISNYETQKYDVILSDKNFEIRFYGSSLKAKVASDTSCGFAPLTSQTSIMNAFDDKVLMISIEILIIKIFDNLVI